ncbi:MAG: 50S ribosomal protein L18 [Christensenellales bacterium]|jgi:large subunit ribosomal protein L18|nr:50S ribosomal protein L18 [Clostridiales bacterium]
MFNKRDRNQMRKNRHRRVRKKVSGTPDIPRLSVFRSNSAIYAQIIDDTRGLTLASASTMDESIKSQLDELDKKGASKAVGKLVGERALAAGVTQVVFDRSGYIYTGRVANLADGAREAGLKF